MKISITLLQRLSLETIIRSSKGPDGEGYLTLFDTWMKIRVADLTRRELIDKPCGTCGLSQRLDIARIESAPETEIEFEKGEIRKLISLLSEWKQFSVDDGIWMLPLKAALNTALEPEKAKSKEAN